MHPLYTLITKTPHNKLGAQKSENLFLIHSRIVYSSPSRDGEIASGLTDPPLLANDKRYVGQLKNGS